MPDHLMTQAVAAAGRVKDARGGSALDAAVREFVGVLRTVPDCAAHELSEDAVKRLGAMGEQIIEHIERQIEDGSDSSTTQQDLASGVYAIRAALEEADRWVRHYAR